MSDFAASPLRIVLLGPPASGKGTQGRRLADELGLAFLSCGALLREHVAAESPVGRLAKPILDRGGYLPDELMCRLLGEWLGGQHGGWVLDGFPRSEAQARFLEAELASQNLRLDAAISLDAPFETLLARIGNRVECPSCRWTGQRDLAGSPVTCGECGAIAMPRPDDDVANFTSRYHEFSRLTQPLIAFYQERLLLVPCAAIASEQEVAAGLLQQFTRPRDGSAVPDSGFSN